MLMPFESTLIHSYERDYFYSLDPKEPFATHANSKHHRDFLKSYQFFFALATNPGATFMVRLSALALSESYESISLHSSQGKHSLRYFAI